MTVSGKFGKEVVTAAQRWASGGNKVAANDPIDKLNLADLARGILRERVGVRQAPGNGGLYIKNDNTALYDAIGGKREKTSKPKWFKANAPTDWQLAKSLFYNRQGEFQYGRAAGAAVGLGGGAIATLNLAYDMVT